MARSSITRLRAPRTAAPVFALVLAGASALSAQSFSGDVINGLPMRNIGPAVMGGRVSALDAVRLDGRLHIYAGGASAGVWKSIDGGITFKPIFDRQNQTIGAITIHPADSKTVWVGTGEPWVRNSVSVGDGVYRTTDGGDSWTKLGLEQTERIASIAVDPTNTNVAWVCALGPLFNDSDQRGVFKTTDGGKSWAKVLAGANLQTGCAMLRRGGDGALYAAMWKHRRTPWSFASGGPGSGLFRSRDGGATWQQLTTGFPKGDVGRFAIAIAPTNPKVVYATVESKSPALFRSNDGGDSWTEQGTATVIADRPFYFANMYVDPKDENRVYKAGYTFGVSIDAGKSFQPVLGAAHGDHHVLWIDPNDPDQLLIGDDGGLHQSFDRGAHLRMLAVLPFSQFYHVSVDMERPYRVVGGLQDNLVWIAPSSAPGGVKNRHWTTLMGGDGFWAFVDPTDPDWVYTEWQGGRLGRVNVKTLETRWIAPLEEAGQPPNRWHWNTAVHMSRANPGTLYVGSQFLFRSSDQGSSWQRLSGDLTTNDPKKQQQDASGGVTVDNTSAETHTTIYTISESPKDPKVLWVGTDDGNVQLSRDGGATWTNVAANVWKAGLPKGTWVSTIEASPHDAAVAYATFDGHMMGDLKPWIYKTADYGVTWTPLLGGELTGFAHVIRQDLINPALLFAGTERGLFVSIDEGTTWAHYQGSDFPEVPVRDLVVHPREHDLVVATHGRGIWIMDDLTALRAVTVATLSRDGALLPGRPAVQAPLTQVNDGGEWGNGTFAGPSAPEDAQVTYYLKARHLRGELKLQFLDQTGRLLATVAGSKRKGLNRVNWPMRLDAPKSPPAASGLVLNFGALVGPRVPPGTYTVRMIRNTDTLTAPLVIQPDPRTAHTVATRQQQYQEAVRLADLLGELTVTTESLIDARDQASDRIGKLPTKDKVRTMAETFSSSLDGVRGQLTSVKEAGGAITGEEKLREKIGDLYGNVNSFDGVPTKSQFARRTVLDSEFRVTAKAFEEILEKQLPKLNEALKGKKLDPIVPKPRQVNKAVM
jgi:photosystem II stability/assembly factor-like uncharacterized protein